MVLCCILLLLFKIQHYIIWIWTISLSRPYYFFFFLNYCEESHCMVLPKPVFFHSRTARLNSLPDFCKKHCMEVLLGTHVSVSWPYIYKGNGWVRRAVHLYTCWGKSFLKLLEEENGREDKPRLCLQFWSMSEVQGRVKWKMGLEFLHI